MERVGDCASLKVDAEAYDDTPRRGWRWPASAARFGDDAPGPEAPPGPPALKTALPPERFRGSHIRTITTKSGHDVSAVDFLDQVSRPSPWRPRCSPRGYRQLPRCALPRHCLRSAPSLHGRDRTARSCRGGFARGGKKSSPRDRRGRPLRGGDRASAWCRSCEERKSDGCRARETATRCARRSSSRASTRAHGASEVLGPEICPENSRAPARYSRGSSAG